jgi:hypothetical protein
MYAADKYDWYDGDINWTYLYPYADSGGSTMDNWIELPCVRSGFHYIFKVARFYQDSAEYFDINLGEYSARFGYVVPNS